MDPNAFSGLDDKDSKDMMKIIEDMQMRDSLKMYNRLVERCFGNCVDSFRRKNLTRPKRGALQSVQKSS